VKTVFRENNEHLQTSIMESTYWMSSGIRKKLEKSWAPVFYEHVFCNIDEKPFSVLYSDTGCPNFPVNILLSLELIKHMKNISDDELMDSFYFDYLVNYAVGIRTLGEINLAEKTLYNFRSRIYTYLIEHPQQEDLVFGQFISLTQKFAEEAGISFSEQRMDTTMFMSNIKKAGRLVLAFDVLHKAVSAIPQDKCTEELSKVLEDGFKTELLYKSKPSENDSRLENLLNMSFDSMNILNSIPELQDSDELRIVTRFLSEQAYLDGSGGVLKAKDSKDIPTNSLQSAYDEDATYRKKGSKGQSGYVLAIAETCSKDNPFQLISDYQVDRNIKSDVDIINDRLPEICSNTECTDMYVDGGFYSDSTTKTGEENNVDVHFTDLTGVRPHKKLPVTEYEIDEDTNIILKCPKGEVPTSVCIKKGQTVARFPLEVCSGCEFREQCHSKQQKKDCVVRITLKAVQTAKQRDKVETAKKETTSKRAAIEGTNSALKRGHGLDKLRVRGGNRCTAVAGLKVLAQNIKRFTRYMLGGYQKTEPNQCCTGEAVPIFG
jgi:hypothetical protein